MIACCPNHKQRFAGHIQRKTMRRTFVQCPYCDLQFVHKPKENVWLADIEQLMVHELTDIYVAIFHQPSGNFYTLNRSYTLNPVCPISHDDLLQQCLHVAVETEDQHRPPSAGPIWLEDFDADIRDFTTFWLY